MRPELSASSMGSMGPMTRHALPGLSGCCSSDAQLSASRLLNLLEASCFIDMTEAEMELGMPPSSRMSPPPELHRLWAAANRFGSVLGAAISNLMYTCEWKGILDQAARESNNS